MLLEWHNRNDGWGLLNIVICVVLFAILMGIVNFVINHYFAYLVKAGHVAVIAQTFKEGRVPDNCVSVGKAMVKDRFGTANAYFAIDKLVSGADSVKSATNFFLNISLGYIDECCLSYTFYNKGQNAYKSACDGVVIYAQNWKHLLKNAAMTALTVIVSILVVTLVAFVLFGGAFRLLGWSGFVAFVLAVMLAWTIKFAFIDSWMMVKMMHGYMQVAPSTVITYDLFTRLSALSSSFKKLFNESRVTPMVETVVEPTAESAVQAEAEAPLTPIPTEETKTRFCPECGTPLKEGMAFCGNCGTKVG